MTNVKVVYNTFMDEYQVLFYEEGVNGSRYVAQPVQWVMQKVEQGDSIEPTMRIPAHTMGDFARCLKDLDVRTESDSKLEGTLEAMSLHLTDMRRLVFGSMHPESK
jgi:hypothetical protein